MLALIDGDVLAYNACESRFKKDSNGHWMMDLNNMKGDIEFTPEEARAYLEGAWENFQHIVEEICARVFATDYLMAVKGPDNFRSLLYPEYKMNRHKRGISNETVPALRELAVQRGMAIAADGREADDLLRIWAEECRKVNEPYIVCSIDKDLKCIVGKHYFIHKDVIQDIDHHYANRFYYEQLLKGDPTDNIPGIPKVGEVKAQKALALCKTDEEFQEKVIEMYMTAYGDAWYDYLLSNGKMIHLQKTPTDYFGCYHWPLVKELLDLEKNGNRSEEVSGTGESVQS
jgi:5'-3' exonuclease